MGPWRPGMSLLDKSLQEKKRTHKSKKKPGFGKLWWKNVPNAFSGEKQKQLNLSWGSVEHLSLCFHLAKIKIKNTPMYYMLPNASPSNYTKHKL